MRGVRLESSVEMLLGCTMQLERSSLDLTRKKQRFRALGSPMYNIHTPDGVLSFAARSGVHKKRRDLS